MKIRVVCCAALAGLLISPAMAAITVTLQPFEGMTSADVYADISASDAIIGFGFDIETTGGITFDHFTVALPFDAVSTPDGDGIAGLTLASPVYGPHVLVGTAYFTFTGGPYRVSGSDDYPEDLTEGFALPTPGEFAQVTYWFYAPEPTAGALLGFGALVLLRRR